MKFFLAIFTIAMMAQASMAGSLKRPKRSDEVELAARDMMRISKELVDVSVKVATGIVEDLPDTENYAAYKEDFGNFLTLANEIEDATDNCAAKTITALGALFELFEKYNDEEIEQTEEYLEIEKLFKKYGGEQLEKDAIEFKDKYINEKFEEKINNLKKEGTNLWALAQAEC